MLLMCVLLHTEENDELDLALQLLNSLKNVFDIFNCLQVLIGTLMVLTRNPFQPDL